MGQGASPPRATSPAPRPAFTPPADRVVELRYGKEVGDGKRFAVAVGGLRYRIAPQGSGRWAVTEVVEDPRGDEEATYLLDGLGLQEGEDALLPPVWHTGRREMGASSLSGPTRGAYRLPLPGRGDAPGDRLPP